MISFSVQPQKRTQSDINDIANILKQIHYFSKLSQKSARCFYQCSQYIQVNFIWSLFIKLNIYQIGDTIFHYKSKPEAFYVIYKGEVQVLVPHEIFREGIETNHSIKPTTNDNFIEDYLKPYLPFIKDIDQYYSKGIFRFRRSKTLKDGDSFGELGLIRNQPRAATILCTKQTQLFWLNKFAYENLIKNYEAQRLQNRIDYMKMIFPLVEITQTQLLQIFMEFKKIKLTSQEILFTTTDKANCIYFIKKGQIYIWQDIYKEKQNDDRKLNSTLLLTYIKQINKIPFDLAIIGDGQMIGEESVLFAPKFCQKRLYNCKSFGETKLYMLDEKSIISILENQFVKNFFFKMISQKSHFRKQFSSQQNIKGFSLRINSAKQIIQQRVEPKSTTIEIQSKNLINNKHPLEYREDALKLFSEQQSQQTEKSTYKPMQRQKITFRSKYYQPNKKRVYLSEQEISNPLDAIKLFNSFLKSPQKSPKNQRQKKKSQIFASLRGVDNSKHQQSLQIIDQNQNVMLRPKSFSEYNRINVQPSALYFKKTFSSSRKELFQKNQKIRLLKANEFLGISTSNLNFNSLLKSKSAKKIERLKNNSSVHVSQKKNLSISPFPINVYQILLLSLYFSQVKILQHIFNQYSNRNIIENDQLI